MKQSLMLTALVCVAAAAAVQGQVPAVPDTTLQAQNNDGSLFEFRVGGDIMSGQRNVWFNQSTQQAVGTVEGADGFLWIPHSPFGFSARYLQSNFGAQQPQLVAADANLFFGVPAFSLEGGMGRRALQTTLSTALYSFWRSGFQTIFPIGGSGLRGMLAATYYLPMNQKNDAQPTGQIKNGMDGETALLFNPPHASFLYFKAGYRAEVFTARRTSGNIPEEVRGLTLGGGFQLGGH